jgi:putative addiction module component (TIGR02574 family)
MKMSTLTKEKILSEVLKLSPIDRAQLIEEVLTSFEFTSRKEIDEEWQKEAEDRINAYEQGKLKSKPAKEVFKKINES